MYKIDLNCDMGEGFGNYSFGSDKEMMKWISSANIACGYHAGDPRTMRETVELALEYGVAIGAHPGLPDLQGFGRRPLAISAQEAYDMVLYQIGALQAFVSTCGGVLHHVKPHGALYNMAALDADLAEAIVRAVKALNPKLKIYGLSGSQLTKAAESAGLSYAAEVFADRTYQPNGTLTPRNRPDAVITDENAAINHVLRMVKENQAATAEGALIPVKADTLCLHGDNPAAIRFAQTLHSVFSKEGIKIGI